MLHACDEQLQTYLVDGLLPTPQLAPLIYRVDQLPWPLMEAEQRYFAQDNTQQLPFLVSRHYLSLATDSPDDPIRRQIIPRIEEWQHQSYELSDPLGEKQYQPTPRLIHRYPRRALLLVNDSCGSYCRHCFRRYFSGTSNGSISNGQLRLATLYLQQQPQVKELLLSGGDPMMLSNQRLYGILRELRSQLPQLVLRMATRMPVVLPERFDQVTIALLRSMRPLWLVTHFNHPQELAPLTAAVLEQLVDHGIPVLNQCVLLAGVNDQVDTLRELMERLVELRVKPYYLFQGDLVQGTRHLRVPLARGMEIVRQLRTQLSGIAMPQYAVDLPGGGGKIPPYRKLHRGAR